MAYTFTDMVLAALHKIPLDGHFETILPYQKWIFNNFLWHGDNLTHPGGKEDEFYLQYTYGTTVQYTEPGKTRNPTFSEFLVRARQPLVQMYFEVAYLEEELETRGKAGPLQGSWAIVDYIKSRRQAELLGFYKKLEDDFLSLPILTGNALSMWGLPYHITAITSTQMGTSTNTGAFQGENPVTHASSGVTAGSDWCEIDLSDDTYAGLRNYNFGWEAASAATVALSDENQSRLGRAFRQLDFQGPIDMADLSKAPWNSYRFFTDDYMCDEFGIAARQQNDNLGKDIVKYLGTGVNLARTTNAVVVNGFPIYYAPVLDSPTAEEILARGYHPFYGVNLDKLKITVRPQKFMKRRPPASDKVHNPDVYVEYIDTVFNLRSLNPQQVGFNASWIA